MMLQKVSRAVLFFLLVLGVVYNNMCNVQLTYRDEVRTVERNTTTVEVNSTVAPTAAPATAAPWKLDGLAQDSCLYVEDICHSSHRWFYRTNPLKHQPIVSIQTLHADHAGTPTAYRSNYRFEHVEGTNNFTDQCTVSPITNHLVLFSLYSDMLGEFYLRGLMFMWLLSLQYDWFKESQLYLHLYKPYRTLLDSHHLFTGPMRSLPLLDFTTLLDETSCTCIPRLLLCGYQTTNSTEGGRDVYQLEPDPGGDRIPSYEAGGQHFREFRSFLHEKLISNNPHLQEDIRQYRQHILEAHGIEAKQMDDYKVVGLSQRNGRRRWLELREVMQAIQDDVKKQKVVLVEMNVEDKTSSSYQQIVRHGAMDALIGIHGAQLTEAIWMKPGSWVIELLPYVPDGIIMGSWTKTTEQPTPLGVVFDNTDLNHIGYPLQRHSAPYCYDREGDLDCWRQESHPWDDRDFKLEAKPLKELLISYIVKSGAFKLCNDFVKEAGDTFAVYNVICAESDNATAGPHHYYRTMPKVPISNATSSA